MKKIELEHLAPYLPHGLKTIVNHNPYTITVDENGDDTIQLIDVLECGYKPLLRPLSDLTKEIEVNREKFVPIEQIKKILIGIDGSSGGFYYLGYKYYTHNFSYYNETCATLALPYHIIQKLIKWHFDVFNLIQRELAIDTNTI